MLQPPDSELGPFEATVRDAVAWRHHLHRHPELLFDVPWTADFVAEKLADFGCDEVVRGIGRIGVVGVIRGRSTASGRVIGLRAELDALPVDETSNLPYRSEIPGRMHACGHDGHMAMLLGAARQLAATRAFDGTVIVIFQPAEEGGGGARVMLEDGLVVRFGLQQVYGLHNMPHIPTGRIAVRSGPILASSDRFTVTVEGRGGHAAMPSGTVDPLIAACQIVVALQTIVARNADPLDALVVSVTAFEAGTAFNIIPGHAGFRGTVRALRPETRDLAERRLHEIVTGVAGAMGATARIDYIRGYPVTVNHAEPTLRAVAAATAALGAGNVDGDTPPLTGSEDFSFMLKALPGSIVFLGNGDSAELHSPTYQFNDAAIPAGIAYWLALVDELIG